MKRSRKQKPKAKRGRRGENNRVNNSVMVRPVKVPFVHVTSVSFAASGTATVVDIDGSSSSTFTRLDTIAPVFQFYRIEELSITVQPYTDTSTADNHILFGYLQNEDGSTSGTTFADFSDIPVQKMMSAKTSVPLRFNVPRRLLVSDPQKMFPTAGGATHADYVQGRLHISPRTTSTTTLVITFRGVCTYFAPTTKGSHDLVETIIKSLSEKPDFDKAASKILLLINDLSRRGEK